MARLSPFAADLRLILAIIKINTDLERMGDQAVNIAYNAEHYLSETAIELSMLGATHACANPITARYGTTHGNAIAILLPHVVRWNAGAAGSLYAELLQSADVLATRLSELAAYGTLPRTLREAGVSKDALPGLASEAAEQWTGTFNPRAFDAKGALEIYQCAF